MAKITPILWTSRKTASGLYPIKIRVTETVNAKTIIKYHMIGYSIPVDSWDEYKNRVHAKKHPLAPEINLKISEILLQLEKNDLRGDGAILGDKESFFWWTDRYLESCKKKLTAKGYRKEANPLTQLKEFAGNIKVRQFDLSLLTSFEAHLLDKGTHQNTVSDYMTKIKRSVKLMVYGGAMEFHKNPFNGLTFKKQPREKDRLTFEQITHFKNYPLKRTMKIARDWFIIGFYCGAPRIGDLFRLRPSNFVDGRLIFTTFKTKYNQNIQLPPEAIELLEQYNYRYPSNVQLLSELEDKIFHPNPSTDLKLKRDKIDLQIDIAGNLYREALKRALKTAGLPEVTPHTTRHSIADYALEMNLSSQEIQSLLTHSKLSTTVVYLKGINKKVTDSGTKKLWGSAPIISADLKTA